MHLYHTKVNTWPSRQVKQEIAKEGVLPFSRFFARSTTTPTAKIGSWLRSRRHPNQQEEALEQSPAAALFLHSSYVWPNAGSSIHHFILALLLRHHRPHRLLRGRRTALPQTATPTSMGEEARLPALGRPDCCHHLYVSDTPH